MKSNSTAINQASPSHKGSASGKSAPRSKQQWLSTLLLFITCAIIVAFLSDSLLRHFQ